MKHIWRRWVGGQEVCVLQNGSEWFPLEGNGDQVVNRNMRRDVTKETWSGVLGRYCLGWHDEEGMGVPNAVQNHIDFLGRRAVCAV
jgi:hypothetical protein